MNQGIDQLIAQRMGSAGGNPQALQQQYKQSGDIVTLIAMQKMKTDLERKAQETQLQMQTTPQTIAQQREQEVLGLTKQEVSQQLQPGIQQLGQQMAQAQQAPQGPPQGISSVPRPPMGMAAGGIVAFQEGGGVDPRALLEGTDSQSWKGKIANALSAGATAQEIVKLLKGNPSGLRALAELTSANDNTVTEEPGVTTNRVPREPQRIYGDELPVMPPNGMASGGIVGFKEGDKVPAPKERMFGWPTDTGGYKTNANEDTLYSTPQMRRRAMREQIQKAKAEGATPETVIGRIGNNPIAMELVREIYGSVVADVGVSEGEPAGPGVTKPRIPVVPPKEGISPEQARINQYGDIGASLEKLGQNILPERILPRTKDYLESEQGIVDLIRKENPSRATGASIRSALGGFIPLGQDVAAGALGTFTAVPRALWGAVGEDVSDFASGLLGVEQAPKKGTSVTPVTPAKPDLPPEPDAKEAAIQGSGIGAVANAQGTPSEQDAMRTEIYDRLRKQWDTDPEARKAAARGEYNADTAGSRGIAALQARREREMEAAIAKQQDPETLRRNKLKATLLGMGSSQSQYASNAFSRGLAGSMNEQSRQDSDKLGGIATLNKMAGDRMDKLRPLEEGVFNAGKTAYDTANDNAYKATNTGALMSNADQVAAYQEEANRLRADLNKITASGADMQQLYGRLGDVEKELVGIATARKKAADEDGTLMTLNMQKQKAIEDQDEKELKRVQDLINIRTAEVSSGWEKVETDLRDVQKVLREKLNVPISQTTGSGTPATGLSAKASAYMGK